MEDQNNAHGKPIEDGRGPSPTWAATAHHRHRPQAAPRRQAPRLRDDAASSKLPTYELGRKSPPARPTARPWPRSATPGRVVALDGEVSNSTFAEIFRDAHPERYFESYIAECQMVATAVGLQVRGWVPFASTFAAFFARAYDFVRMAAVSRASLALVGSHAGVSIGEDGPSQMGLEDLAAFRAVHSSAVLYPCDANQTAKLVAAMADIAGIRYLRTTRATPAPLRPRREFAIGGAKVLRPSDADPVTLVGGGITPHEALKAADALAAEGISARVVDAYSVKPIDAATITAAARATGGKIVVAEDHWPEGGLGDAVLGSSPTPTRPCPHPPGRRGMPTSGKPAELLAAAGIDAAAIADAARGLLK